MKANNSLSQFVKDGLAGVAVAILIFELWLAFSYWLDGLIMGPAGGRSAPLSIAGLKALISGPMIFVYLTAFIASGIAGRLVESIKSRKEWAIPMLKLSGVSFLVGIELSTIEGILSIYTATRQYPAGVDGFAGILEASIIGCGLTTFSSLLAVGLIVATSNPDKWSSRLQRLILGSMIPVFAAFGAALGVEAYFSL